jgi:pimeloyl-ACP methyl ester carboxylesterase
MRISGFLLVVVLLLAAALYWFRTPDADIGALEAKYGTAPSQFVTLPLGERVHLRDQGNPDGRTLLLIHGTSASLHTWEPWVKELGDTYRIITLDLPGHGLTGPIPSCDYSIECYLRMIEDVREQLGLEHFVIGGNSLGGNISWRYALAYGHHVDGLVLLDASGGPQIHKAALTPAFVLAQIPVANLLLEVLTPRDLFKKGLEDASNTQGFVTDEKVERYWQLGIRPGNRTAMRKRFTAPDRNEQYRSQLPDLEIPTLILWGREDQFVDLADGEWFARTLPDVTLSIYDDVGHLPMAEVPVLSAADARVFLENLPPVAQQ